MTCEIWQRASETDTGPENPEVLAHLAACAECRGMLLKWRTIEPELRDSLALDVGNILTDDRAVLERARRGLGGRRAAKSSRAAWIGATAAAAATAAVLLIAVTATRDVERPVVAPAVSKTATALISNPGAGPPERLDLIAGRSVDVPAGGSASVLLGAHRIEIDGASAVRFADVADDLVSVELRRGRATFDVDFGARRGKFAVDAGGVLVTVKGTRFTVARSATRVAVEVSEGLVAVTRAGADLATLGPGQRFEVDTAEPPPASAAATSTPGSPGAAAAAPAVSTARIRAPAAPATPEPTAPDTTSPDLATLRSWIVAGRLAEAEAGLDALVAQRPEDADAWWVLGDCRRRAGNAAGAAEAYLRVVASGSKNQADLARLKAGTLLQERLGRHEDAVALFREYLRGGGSSLRAEVLVRCGRSLVALGRSSEAQPLLLEVVERHAANPVAAEARELLEKVR